MSRAETLLAAGRLIAIEKAPYLARRIQSLVLVAQPGRGSMACSADGDVFYDPADIESRTAMGTAWGIVHEALHLSLGHHERVGGRDLARWNLAADLPINAALLQMALKPPARRPLPKDFGLEEHQTAERYYALLFDKPLPDALGLGAGLCGSCAGHPAPGEVQGAGRSAAQNARINAEVARAVQAHAVEKGRGSVPNNLLLWANTALAPPKMRWQDELARAIRAGVAATVGGGSQDYLAPSRRQAGLGYGVGWPVLPRIRAPRLEAAIGFDTSGSMGREEREAGLNEAAGVLAASGSGVTLVAFDAAVRVVKRVWTPADFELRGGGGTDFRPMFDTVDALRPRPSVLVVVTDGDGWAPDRPPAGIHVVWCLVGRPARSPVPWGVSIVVD